MSKNERRGVRRKRMVGRQPELGYYLIVTDTRETEKNYFYGLRDSIPAMTREKIVIKVKSTSTKDLIAYCKESVAREPQFRIPWIILDRDQVERFDAIIEEAEREGICAGWSNPCIEIWFHAYFGSMPTCKDSLECCKSFARRFSATTGKAYEKAGKDIYNTLNSSGDEGNAIKTAEMTMNRLKQEKTPRPSEMSPCTTLHFLVGEIRRKTAGSPKA